METGWGRKPIPGANNYFGIKASARADGTVNYGPIAKGWTWAWTQEWDGAEYVQDLERFRVYESMTDSFHDLGRLYVDNARYARAMAAIDDPRAFAHRLAEAGYATDPEYAARLVRLMDQANLYQYDLPRDDAQFLDQSDYPTADPGQILEIYFEIKNSGLATWRAQDGYFLANANDTAWGASPMQVLADNLAPDETLRWRIKVVAPEHSGTYRTEWTMQHGANRFGPLMYIQVMVREPDQVSGKGVMGPTAIILLLIALFLALFASFLWVVRMRSKLDILRMGTRSNDRIE